MCSQHIRISFHKIAMSQIIFHMTINPCMIALTHGLIEGYREQLEMRVFKLIERKIFVRKKEELQKWINYT